MTPAGTITASQIGETLYLVGDQFDNVAELRSSSDILTVIGYDTAIETNGTIANEATFSGIRNLDIKLGAGDDYIQFGLTHFSLAGNLTLDTGEGTDNVFAYRLDLGGNADIKTGQNGILFHLEEQVWLDFFNLGGNLTIDTGPGRDVVHLRGHFIGGDLIVDTGEGNDQVTVIGEDLFPLAIGGNVQMSGGAGHFDLLRLDATWLGSASILEFENVILD